MAEKEEKDVQVKEGTIQLSDKFRLRFDSLCNKWIEILKTSKTGTSRYDRYTGYFNNYAMLLSDFTSKGIAGCDATTVVEKLTAISDAEAHAKKVAYDLGKELDKRGR